MGNTSFYSYMFESIKDNSYFDDKEWDKILNNFKEENPLLIGISELNKSIPKKSFFSRNNDDEKLIINYGNPYVIFDKLKKDGIVENFHFGLESGIFFSDNLLFIIEVTRKPLQNNSNTYKIDNLFYELSPETHVFEIDSIFNFSFKIYNNLSIDITDKFYQLSIKNKNYIQTIRPFKEYEVEIIEKLKTQIQVEKKKKQNQIKSTYNKNLNKSILELDKNKDGIVDLIDENVFNQLLNKSQKLIIEIDKTYIQKFVKISIYLKTKKSNIQIIFESLKKSKNDSETSELVGLLRNQIYTYELLVFHSLSMISSLVENDLITFYEIYECFDKLSVFNSNWENEISQKLIDIQDGIRNLMYSINDMESKLIKSIDKMNYMTQDSINELGNSIEERFSTLQFSMEYNNLFNRIQSYKINSY